MIKMKNHIEAGLNPKDGCLKEELLDLPLINFLDPNSIRSVGAFNRCVFKFGEERTH